MRTAMNMGECMLEQWMSIVVVIIAGAVGYLAGVLRDRGQTKANRNARHEDETLAAAATVVEGARLMCKATDNLAWARTHLEQQYRAQIPGPNHSAQDKPVDESERNQAWKDQANAKAIFQPAQLRLSILKPELSIEATKLLEETKCRGRDYTQWPTQTGTFDDAEKVFIDAVRKTLKVKGKVI